MYPELRHISPQLIPDFEDCPFTALILKKTEAAQITIMTYLGLRVRYTSLQIEGINLRIL
jgi:hypothetical protein